VLAINFILLLVSALFFVLFVSFSLFVFAGRFSVCLEGVKNVIKGLVSFKVPLFILFYTLLVVNVLGNMPAHTVPTLFYSETLTLSLLF
jgi:hypothetical protein